MRLVRRTLLGRVQIFLNGFLVKDGSGKQTFKTPNIGRAIALDTFKGLLPFPLDLAEVLLGFGNVAFALVVFTAGFLAGFGLRRAQTARECGCGGGKRRV